MANALYDKGRESFAKGEINLAGDTIKCVLVDTGQYTVNLATDQFLSDIPSGARVATSGAMANKTTTAGVFDADDTVFTGLTGISIEAVAIYQDTGSAGTSRLIAYLDTVTGLPLTPSGADFTLNWPSSATRIFKL